MATLSEFQTRRAINAPGEYAQPPHPFIAAHLDDSVTHFQVVLPGAKRAITHAELFLRQAQGMSEREIVELVNSRWEQANAHRIAAFESWRDGERIEREREVEQKRRDRLIALAELEVELVARAKARES